MFFVLFYLTRFYAFAHQHHLIVESFLKDDKDPLKNSHHKNYSGFNNYPDWLFASFLLQSFEEICSSMLLYLMKLFEIIINFGEGLKRVIKLNLEKTYLLLTR